MGNNCSIERSYHPETPLPLPGQNLDDTTASTGCRCASPVAAFRGPSGAKSHTASQLV